MKTSSLFSKSNILKGATIHSYFGGYQFPWLQACEVFTNSGYFLITCKLMASKESLKILTPKLPVTSRITQL